MSCKSLYYDYYELFNVESSLLREELRKEQLVTPAKPTPTEIIQPSTLQERFWFLFLGMTDFSRNTLDIQTRVAIVSKEESPREINQAYTALAAMGAFLTLINPKKTYEASKKRHQFFAAQGIEPPKTDAMIAIEAISDHKKDWLILVASNIATGLLIIPDVTTVFTKGAAAGIFILIGLYNTVKTLYAANETQQRLSALRDFTPEADSNKKTYQAFIDEVLTQGVDKKVREALLNAGEELQAADLNLQTTTLTNQQWKILAEKTLSFKRNAQILNAIRTIFSTIALLFIMIPSTVALATAKLATSLASFAPQSAFAGRIASIGLIASAMAQQFSQFSLFNRFVFKKLPFNDKLKIAQPIFSKNQIKALFYRFSRESSVQFALKIKALGLTNTLLLLQKMKDNDPLLEKHPTLKQKLDHLKDGLNRQYVLKEDDQIQQIQAIADRIGSVPAITPTQRLYLGDCLSKASNSERFNLTFASNQLTEQPLLAYEEESQKLIRRLKKAIAKKNEEVILITLRELSVQHPPKAVPEAVFTEAELKKFQQAAKGQKHFGAFKEIIEWLHTLKSDHDALKIPENRLLIERIKTETKPEIIRNQLILLGRMLRNAPDHDGQESSTSVDVASIPFARRGGSPMLIPSTNRP
jgi:hypothetical protein